MAGFLGWYIHMATVAWLRLYRNDVASVKIHGRFLSRALMIFGFALVLSPVPQAVSVPLAFLLGIFPFALPASARFRRCPSLMKS